MRDGEFYWDLKLVVRRVRYSCPRHNWERVGIFKAAVRLVRATNRQIGFAGARLTTYDVVGYGSSLSCELVGTSLIIPSCLRGTCPHAPLFCPDSIIIRRWITVVLCNARSFIIFTLFCVCLSYFQRFLNLRTQKFWQLN